MLERCMGLVFKICYRKKREIIKLQALKKRRLVHRTQYNIDILNKDCRCSCSAILSYSFFSSHFFSRTANLPSGVDVVHATRQVCCPAEKTARKKTTRLK